jgi:HSP20 family molecular chaperone IbpA
VILADMPGVSPDGVDVTLERNVLTIRGRTEDSPPQGFSPVYLEYQPGDYERVFTLSEDIEAERIEASVKDGVLRLVLPKAGPAQTKRIQVRAS